MSAVCQMASNIAHLQMSSQLHSSDPHEDLMMRAHQDHTTAHVPAQCMASILMCSFWVKSNRTI